MGRRKIEIKPITDERNRSVTFLKRKGGLFKKAHELSVLCAVDVAVIVFGSNKKLYTYGSRTIDDIVDSFHFAPRPGDHKGPQDFGNKDDGDDEDDDDDGNQGVSRYPPMPPYPADQPGYVERATAQMAAVNGSPRPGARGVISRHHTPQPHSRPASSNEMRRRDNFVNHDSRLRHQQTSLPNGTSYMSQAPMYPVSHAPAGPAVPQPPQHYPGPQDNSQYYDRREAYPASYQQQHNEQQQQGQQQLANLSQSQEIRPPSPQNLPGFTSTLQAPPRTHGRTYSTLTPIDDSKSLLSRQFLGGSRTDAIKQEAGHVRPKSVDTSATSRPNGIFTAPGPPLVTPGLPSAGQSVAQCIARMNMGSPAHPGDRPSLKLQIPSEQSDSGAGTAGDSAGPSVISPRPLLNGGTPGILHLPPPSPSANSILSAGGAGATGPPNPYARPAIPPQNNRNDTPASALPSRFMADILDSPSNNLWYGNGQFGDNPASSILPSPLEFKTGLDGGAPLAFGMARRDVPAPTASAPPILAPLSDRDDNGELKRKSSETEIGVDAKRIKT